MARIAASRAGAGRNGSAAAAAGVSRAASRRRLAARVAVWLSPLLAAAAARQALDAAQERALLAEGIERLAAADPSAAPRFEALLGSRRHAALARGGLRLSRALAGLPADRALAGEPAAAGAPRQGWAFAADAAAATPPRDRSGERAAALDRLGISLVGLMDGALRAGRVEVCRELALIARDAGQVCGTLYLAAAHLERAEDDEARALAAGAPALFASTALGRALGEALDWRARGAVTLVRDRRGVLLGALDAEGRFEARDEPSAACVPSPAIQALARAGPAPSVRLSLDLRLCALAAEALDAERGTLVLLDPATGALRAAVSDARTLRREPLAAFTQLREPASTAKLVTTTAALRAGLDPDAAIRGTHCPGSRRYADGTLWCAAPARPLHGLAHALAVSCNLAFADLAHAIGRDALLEEYRRYGFVVADGLGVEDEPAAGDAALAPFGAGARVLASAGGDRQLADLAIGLQDVLVTPLYGARLAAVFAHGALPGVALVEATDGVLGRSPRPLLRAAPAELLEPGWLEQVWPAMQAVAEWGTASGVAPPDFPVAMKTGTASQWHAGYHCNHLGVGPLPAPALAFSVRVTHHRTSFSASAAARQVTARLLDGLARRHPGRRAVP